MPDGMRRCSNGEKCEGGNAGILPATTDYFYRRGKGFRAECIACENHRSQRHYESNQDELRAKARVNAHNKKPRRKVYLRQWKQNNFDHIRVYGRYYRKSNALLRRLWESNRRARINELPNEFTHDDYVYMMEYWGWACAISGETENLQIDHWIPITSENCPGTIPTNMIPLSEYLNRSKQNKDAAGWLMEIYPDEAENIIAKISAYFSSLNSE